MERKWTIEQLEPRWRALEARSNRSFFLSWSWIGSWLAELSRPPLLVSVRGPGGDEIGLGLLTETTEIRKRVIRAKQLNLHLSGESALDAITIEYNGLLSERGLEELVAGVMIAALQREPGLDWDELIVPGLADGDTNLFKESGLSPIRRAEASSCFVDLAALRAEGVSNADQYCATLGKSTRSQIRRSMRIYGEHGPLALDSATSSTEAWAFLDEMAIHHEQKWRAHGGGAFSNARYLSFHRRLIDSALPIGQIEVLRARAGDQAFGWIYNFIDRGRVLFYLSGFAISDDNRLKPGLVTHALAIQRHLRAGMDAYDFMGGDNRYKKNLGQPGPEIVSIALQRPRAKLKLESAARNLKDQIKRLRS